MPVSIPFWSDDPTILLNKDMIYDVWPQPKMAYEQKLNAITRLIIILTFLGFLFTMNIKIVLIGFVTVLAIVGLFKTRKQKATKETFHHQKEGFESGGSGAPMVSSGRGTGTLKNPETLVEYLKTDFETNSKKNPFANVLLTDIQDNPSRKAAPPSFNPEVYEDITHSVKKMVQKLNPEIKNTNKQLFGDLGENFYLDQSNRNFYSTPNTKIPNDQGAFADFLYGDMPSCKDGDPFACLQDNIRYNLY